ncbi:MAG: type II secretion system F family protein [Pseudomonadota bacterium]|jgi:Flp pilus assembly protein TadB
MDQQTTVLIIIGCAVFVLATMIAMEILRAKPASGRGRRNSLRGQLEDYRQDVSFAQESNSADAFAGRADDQDSPSEVEGPREKKQGQTLRARLRYANLAWMPPLVITLLQMLISLGLFAVAYVYLRLPLQIVAAALGPLIVNAWINMRITKRVRKFDADFAPFLLSVVGMLKTGLNPMQALEAAAESLDEESLVRQEVELMLERVRMGVPEDRSIGSFGEDFDQPEIELFVQALLLSRRVGGTLSDTLDRLSKQVRKRQTFKMAATGAVSMQRGSIYAIIAVIGAVQVYMYFMAPVMVVGAWTNPKLTGWAQGAVVIIFIAILTVNKLTKIKI